MVRLNLHTTIGEGQGTFAREGNYPVTELRWNLGIALVELHADLMSS